MANGRLILGAGAGCQEELEAIGYSYADRGTAPAGLERTAWSLDL